MSELGFLYDDLHKRFIKNALAGEILPDKTLENPDDNRFGLTLGVRVPSNCLTALEDFKVRFSEIEPGQYFYRDSEVHITILSVISCVEGFRLTDIQPEEYIQIISQTCKKFLPFTISFKGIGATDAALILKGFPEDDSLRCLRDALRNEIKESGLRQTMDQRYPLVTAHGSFIRFQKPFNNPEKLVKFLEEYRNFPVGSFTVSEVSLTYNDWFHTSSKTTLLAVIPLGHPTLH